MNVQQVKIEKVKPYDKNPRKNKAAVQGERMGRVRIPSIRHGIMRNLQRLE